MIVARGCRRQERISRPPPPRPARRLDEITPEDIIRARVRAGAMPSVHMYMSVACADCCTMFGPRAQCCCKAGARRRGSLINDDEMYRIIRINNYANMV